MSELGNSKQGRLNSMVIIGAFSINLVKEMDEEAVCLVE
jgi:hypothetical protein